MKASDFPKGPDGRRFDPALGRGQYYKLPETKAWEVTAMIADALEKVAEWEEQEQANLKLQTENQDN